MNEKEFLDCLFGVDLFKRLFRSNYDSLGDGYFRVLG